MRVGRGAARHLRSILISGNEPLDGYREDIMEAAAAALGTLRDPAAVEVLHSLAKDNDGVAGMKSVESLARIGTIQSGAALLDLDVGEVGKKKRHHLDVEWGIAQLIRHGSTACVEKAVQIASRQPDGAVWLMKYATGFAVFRSWARWKFHYHVDTGPLVRFVRAQFNSLAPESQRIIIGRFDQFDGKPLREFLREIARADSESRQAECSEAVSDAAVEALAERGDRCAIPRAVEEVLKDRFFSRRFSESELQNFAPKELTAELTRRLETDIPFEQKCKLLHLIGKFGSKSDATAIARFQNADDLGIANAACESVTRLSDPRLLPEGWI